LFLVSGKKRQLLELGSLKRWMHQVIGRHNVNLAERLFIGSLFMGGVVFSHLSACFF
jgi:hypothetical protein